MYPYIEHMTNRKAGIMIIERVIRQSQQTNQRMIPFFPFIYEFLSFLLSFFFFFFLFYTWPNYIFKKCYPLYALAHASVYVCIRVICVYMQVYAWRELTWSRTYMLYVSPVYECVARNLFIIYYYACIYVYVCTRVCMCINVSINRNWRMN